MERNLMIRKLGWPMLFVAVTGIVALEVSVTGLSAAKPFAVCGNGTAEPGEGCDPGDALSDPDLRGKSCQTEGFDGGNLICTDQCKVDRTSCFCGSGAVPATGQTECWDAAGMLVDCAGTGQDGEVQAGISTSPRFTDNGDGTVMDNLTGLTWLRNAFCFGERTWQAALDDANGLADGSCGLTDGSVAGDWRLPNIKELVSLIDNGQTRPALTPGHPFLFNAEEVGRWWSSTTVADDHPSGTSRAWLGIVGFGQVGSEPKTANEAVWPVRGGL